MTVSTDFIVGEPVYLHFANITLPSGSNGYYIYNQSSPLATWTITHNFGRIPSVTIIDTNNFVIHTDIEYPNNTTVVLTFSTPIAGKALLT